MEITSFSFLCFFAAVLLVYYLLPGLQWEILLAAGVFFYWRSGGFAMMLFPAAAVLLTALLTGRMRKSEDPGKRRTFFILNLAVILGTLFLVKYLNFWRGGSLAVPLGLSFYSFTLAGYVIDLYNGIGSYQENPAKLALYGTYFPLMISGPILSYREHGEQFFGSRRADFRNLTFGAQRVLWGFFKKLVIAERCALIAGPVFDRYEYCAVPVVWLGAAAFTFQLYSDFSGCMDIVLGISEMLGLALPENFRQPFFADSISEYWRRWHITLGVWMREYVFFPLQRTAAFQRLRNALRDRFGKKTGKALSTYCAMFVLWLVVGLWHGGALKYVIGSGLLHWAYIVPGLVLAPYFTVFYKDKGIDPECRTLHRLRVLRTFFLVTVGNIFFRSASAADGFKMVLSGFGFRQSGFLSEIPDGGRVLVSGFSMDAAEWGILLFSLLLLFAVSLCAEKGNVRKTVAEKPLPVRWTLYLGFLFFVILFGNYGPGYSASAFIYQGF